MIFEVSTFLWIAGMVVTYVVAHSIANSKKKKEISDLSAKLSDANVEIEKLKKQLSATSAEIETLKRGKNPPPPKPTAKEIFIKNISKFTTNFNSLLDGSYNSNNWTDDIIDLNNEELIVYWKKIYNKVDSILRMLAMWGIKPETCSSFVGVNSYKEMYITETGDSIEKGIRYIVKSPCWILTDNATGEKKIILKGVVSHERD